MAEFGGNRVRRSAEPHEAFAAMVLAMAVLTGCFAGCSRWRKEVPAATLQLVLRVHLTADAAPIAADIDDEGDAFLVAAARGPVNVWTESSSVAASPAASLPLAEPIAATRFARVGGAAVVFVATETRGAVTLWSWTERKKIYEHVFGRTSQHAALSPDGHFVAIGGTVFDRDTAEPVGPPVPLATQSALAFAAGGERIAIAGFHEPWIAVRDLPGGALRRWPSPDKVGDVTLDARGELVAAVTRDGRIRLWRQPGGEPAGDFRSGVERGGASLRGLRFVQGDRQLVVADEAGVSLCDVATRQAVWHDRVDGQLMSFVVSGDLAAAGTSTGAAVIWDLARQRVLARVQASTTVVTAVAVSERRRRLVVADQTGEVTIWRW